MSLCCTSFAWVFCLLVMPGFAWATDQEVTEFGAVLDRCYVSAAGSEGLRACNGRMSAHSMEARDDYSTRGMVECVAADTAVWDNYLNLEYKLTMDWTRSADAGEAVHFPGYAKRAEALRAAQCAWIGYRDAECALAYARWRSGSMRSIARTGCRADMMAARTVELYELGSEFE